MSRPNAPTPAPSASGTWVRAANGQQSVPLGLLVGIFLRLVANYGNSRCRPAAVGYRRGRSRRARPGAGPPGYPVSRPRDPMFAVPSQADSIASSSASQPPARRQSLRDSGCTRRQIRSLGAAVKLASSCKGRAGYEGSTVKVATGRPRQNIDRVVDRAEQALPLRAPDRNLVL